MIKAVFFDFDGTLMDSEAHTAAAIREVMDSLGFPGVNLEPERTQGRAWVDIIADLHRSYPLTETQKAHVSDNLTHTWHRMVKTALPLPGAREALRAASRRFKLAVVSSSRSPYLREHLERLGMGGFVSPEFIVGADKISRYKPDPEGYLLAADLCGVDPSECLVFEDSSAGLTAARAAGMHRVAITAASGEEETCRRLAHAVRRDFEGLTESHWETLAASTEISLKLLFEN